jgi:hypothetical protein
MISLAYLPLPGGKGIGLLSFRKTFSFGEAFLGSEPAGEPLAHPR